MGEGTVYKVRADGSDWRSIVSFDYGNPNHRGYEPRAALVSDGVGFLWGTTNRGGANDSGTIFKVRASDGELTRTTNGTTPQAISAALSGLIAGRTYYYRVVGVNAENAQPQRGIIRSFTLPGTTPREAWRQAYFGTTANAGAAADLADPDRDGIVNLLEFALGLHPNQSSVGFLPKGAVSSGDFMLAVIQSPGVSGIIYGGEWSATLQPGSWVPIPDTGTPPQHTFRAPIGANGKGFLRLKVTAQ